MHDIARYYGQVLKTALWGSLSAASTWSTYVVGLGLPIAFWVLGKSGNLNPDVAFWLTWGTLASVIAVRVAWAPYKIWKDERPIREELARLKDYQRKADVLCGLRTNLIERMNRQLRNRKEIDDWRNAHSSWVDAARKTVEREISSTEAHTIFDIGDASKLPPEEAISEDPIDVEYATQMRWLRYYSNTMLSAIERFSRASQGIVG